MSSVDPRYARHSRSSPQWNAIKVRLLIGVAIVLISIVSYYGSGQRNPLTGRHQRVAGLSPDDEVAIGLQAAPQMMAQHRGESRDLRGQREVDRVGVRLLNALYQLAQERKGKVPYEFDFHLLADDKTVNAFALPGGQVFITAALYERLQNEAQLAGVLGHEVGHVIERHGAQAIAKGNLLQGIAGAAGVAGGSQGSAQLAQMIGAVTQLKYGRQAELESDRWAVVLMARAGYNPAAMITVMDILEDAGGGDAPPEILSTHPKPENRREYIREILQEQFPGGVSPDLGNGGELHPEGGGYYRLERDE